MPDWLGTTINMIAGGVLTMLTTWLGDRRLTKRDRERRREERRERVQIRSNDFQRETLLAHRSTGKWQRQQLPNELANNHLRLTTGCMLLASRVRDDEVCALADQLRAQTTAASLSRDESEAVMQMGLAADTQRKLIPRIGKLVRDLDEAE